MKGLKLGDGLTLPLELATEPLGILANRGRGKTYAAHVLVEEVHDAGVPVVILDVKGDWWGVRSSADGRSEGMPFYIFGGDEEHRDLPLEPTAGELLADLVVDERVSVVLDLSHLSKTKARTFATAFAERLYHRNREPVFLVVDEADVLIPQRATSDTARLLGAMEDLAKRGRGRGIGMVVVTQRPQEVAKSVLDLMETLILLGMTGPRALKSVAEWTSIHVDDVEPGAVMRQLPTMQTGEAYIWSPVHDVLKRIRVRPLRTYDSHPTPKPGETRRKPRKWTALDLEQLGAKIADTVERARDNDPRLLRVQLEEQRRRAVDLEREVARLTELAEARGDELEELAQRDPEHVNVVEPAIVEQLEGIVEELAAALATVHGVRREEVSVRHVAPTPPPAPARPTRRGGITLEQPTPTTVRQLDGTEPELRKGARRMVEALGRMAPLRLTKAQWGTVAGLKTSGGTWSTYVGDLRKRGFIDENAAGYTLTRDGFDYIGGQPAPMTAAELQDHYRTILRAGAVKILDALMAAFPGSLSREAIGESAELAITGGTFSTYLGDLTRNGLAEKVSGEYRATDLLMYGAKLRQ